MNRLTSFWQKLRIGQILAIFLVGFALLITTACSGGDVVGARPDNPAVQAGGGNEVESSAPETSGDASGLLYPGSGTTPSAASAKRDPNSNFLERTGEAIKDSSAFIEDTLDSATERPELQANPAIQE